MISFELLLEVGGTGACDFLGDLGLTALTLLLHSVAGDLVFLIEKSADESEPNEALLCLTEGNTSPHSPRLVGISS